MSVDEFNRPQRWIVLAFSSAILIGNYYVYDTPAALNRQIRDVLQLEHEPWQQVLGTMYSAYSLPNVIMPFFSAILVDYIGVHQVLFLLSTVVLIGAALFATGLQMHLIPVMLFGRFLLGLAGESLGVAQARVICRWFTGSELAFALGINLSVARLGAVLNDVVSPIIATSTSTSTALFHFGMDRTILATWCGVLWTAMSLCTTLILIYLDKFTYHSLAAIEDERTIRHQASTSFVPYRTSTQSMHRPSLSCLDRRGSTQAGNATEPLLKPALSNEDDTFKSALASYGATETGSVAFVEPPVVSESVGSRHSYTATTDTSFDDPVSFRHNSRYRSSVMYVDIMPQVREASPPHRHSASTWSSSVDPDSRTGFESISPTFGRIGELTGSFWVLCAIMICFYGTTIPFINISSDLLQRGTFAHDNARLAGLLIALPDILSTVLVPMCGRFVDSFGRRIALILFSGIVLSAVHGTFAVSGSDMPVPGLVAIGMSYSLYSSLFWPFIGLIVPEHLVPTAYSVATSMLNGGLAIFPLMVGYFVSQDETYGAAESFLSVVAAVGACIFGLILYILDRNCHDGILNSTADQDEDFFIVVPPAGSRDSGTRRWVEQGVMWTDGEHA
ncbi:hypothetical protein HDU85_001459 [Gaertneriomyces sp. JEL0708]|nr:hypothetical protein HDU85_001459 [Gaertneriomyces sp. JEL0708]